MTTLIVVATAMMVIMAGITMYFIKFLNNHMSGHVAAIERLVVETERMIKKAGKKI